MKWKEENEKKNKEEEKYKKIEIVGDDHDGMVKMELKKGNVNSGKRLSNCHLQAAAKPN